MLYMEGSAINTFMLDLRLSHSAFWSVKLNLKIDFVTRKLHGTP